MVASQNMDARLIIAAPSQNADICWATGFWAPDPAVFLEVRGKRYLILRDLEVDRARKNPRLTKVFASSDIERDIRRNGYQKQHGHKRVSWTDMVHHLLKRMHVKKIMVPHDFGGVFADHLRELKYKVIYKEPPFYEERAFKSATEVKKVREVMAVTEKALAKAIECIRKSKAKGDRLYFQGEVLTSDRLRTMIHLELMAGGCVADLNSIVACGAHTADPHDIGKGPLRPNVPIILDLFPRSLASGYYGDITRTVVKGKASPQLRKMYKAVAEAVDVGKRMYKPNVRTPDIFRAVHQVFQDYGFESGEIKGKRQGFIHSVGHGLGLNIHEEPHVGSAERVLQPGHLITLEPGLYYRGVGGIRIEELYLITSNGSTRITKFPHLFEV